MLKKFKQKIIGEGRTYKWWHGKYLGNKVSYGYTMKQLTGYNAIQDDVKIAMQMFLKGK